MLVKVGQVLGAAAMKGFVHEEEQEFVRDAEFYQEPLEVDEGGGAMQGLVCVRTLAAEFWHILEPVQGFAGHPEQDLIAVRR